MTDSNENDPVVVEDPVVDVNETRDSAGISENKGSGSSKYVTVGISVVASVFIYMFFFSSKKSNNDTVDNRAIVKDSEIGAKMNSNVAIDNIDNLADIGYKGDVYVDEKNRGLLELPELPQLPENIVANIEEEIKEVRKADAARDGVFTKEEVDQMINNRLKSFEEDMRKARNESEKLARELDRKKQQEEEENKKKKAKLPIFGGSTETKNTGAESSALGRLAPDGTSLDVLKDDEEKKKQDDERQLQIAQRRKIMEERKGSSMFKMQGGGGGKGGDAEMENIIITDKDNLSSIKETKIDVVTTKNSDLSRTILQGKIIHAILETAINTDIKSPVRAIISRNVYSESGKNIIIPKGSKLIGNFQAMTNNNLSRLEIVWSRIIRVDGLSINLTANTADRLGRGGVDGELDNKYMETMKNVFLSSMISIASAVLVEKVTNSTGTTTSSSAITGTTTTGKASDYAIIDATKTITNEMQTLVDNLKTETPTIRIAQGTRINVVVNQDLVLPIFKKQ
ncbi:MAG: TrbI/VirB10 family protein [Rickettsiales bacterium]|jgi:type IV secretory pathway VirB10-like protein|nr:TrbI/VirB10 family protein [Rickettsiales bacterium]